MSQATFIKNVLLVCFISLFLFVNYGYSQKVDSIKGAKAYITDEVIKASNERRARNGNFVKKNSESSLLNRSSSQSLNDFQNYYIIYGPNPVGAGTIQTYYVAPAVLGGFWAVTCATILDFYDDYITVQFNSSGCTAATITYYSPDLQTVNFNVTINTTNPLSAGTITTGSQVIAYNTKPVNINATVASGGSCSSYTYQWQSSTNNSTFSNINGQTSQNLSFSSLPALTQTTYFRRKVNCGTSEQFTGSVIVEVKPPLSSGTITTTNQTIYYDQIPSTINATPAAGGYCSNYSYYWQRSSDNVIFENIPGANSQNLSLTTGQKEKWYYRRHVVCGSETANSNVVLINVIHLNGEIGDKNMNWITTKGLDPDGKLIYAVKKYYGADGTNLQNQQYTRHRTINNELRTYIFTTQPMIDRFGRQVGSTLPAPLNGDAFSFNSNFNLNSAGSKYDQRNFDKFNAIDKTNNPDPVGGQLVKGSLGWYYGPNNDIEPYTPQTSYPYSRQSFYSDGSGMVKNTSNIGESHKMGSNHEISQYQSVVINELDNYLQIRNKYFTEAEIGSKPNTFAGSASQIIQRDANGKESVIIKDRDGKVLMTARSGSEMIVNNTSIKVGQNNYSFELSGTGSGGEYVSNLSIQSIFTTTAPLIRVYKNIGNGYKLFYEGIASSFVSPSVIRESILIESNSSFNVNYSAFNLGIGSQVVCSGCMAKQNFVHGASFYFKLMSSSIVSITGGTFQLYNMSGNEDQISFTSGSVLSAGYYKLVPTSFDQLSLSYTNSYSDVTYYFYNQYGLQIGILSPEGVKKLYGSGINNFPDRISLPYFTYNEFNESGKLVKSNNSESGVKEFIYRTDGKIRFTQDANQKVTGRFSYINYVSYGRIIENGEYQPDGNGIIFNSNMTLPTNGMRDILDNTSSTGGLTSGTKYDVVITLYDSPDLSLMLSGYVQDPLFLGGGVSSTKKYSQIINNSIQSSNLVSATWFNYDDNDRVIWKVKFINGLGYKTNDYSYDFQNRIVKDLYQKNVSSETFVHYLEYDPESGNIFKVYTNTIDNTSTKVLQAKYIYYAHGPIKRIELASDLQGIDYVYTIAGKLKSINNSNKLQDPGGDTNDAFGMVIDYHTNDYVNSRIGVKTIKGVNTNGIVNDSYNGQIKALTWFSKKPSSLQSIPGIEDPVTNVYSYDDKYQFKENVYGVNINFNNSPATFTQNANFKEKIIDPNNGATAYDYNGNIKYLQRTNEIGSLTERFKYNYNLNTNKVSSIINEVNSQNYASYTYDNLGQITQESTNYNGNFTKYIKYNSEGLVTAISRNAAFSQLVAEFIYDENGQRIIKKSYNASYVLQQITYYNNDVIYTQAGNGAPIIAQEYAVSGGNGRFGVYYRPSNIYVYELTDHLGNVRCVISKLNNSLDVRHYNDFYPFGSVSRRGGSNDFRFDYQGQFSEKDPESNWNNFDLRMYDSKIGRWTSSDPYEQFHSPYLSLGNDPLNMVDPTGGYSWFHATKLYLFYLFNGDSPSWIYRSGGEWGFNTTDDRGVTGHFYGEDHRIMRRAYYYFKESDFVFDLSLNASIGTQAGIKFGKTFKAEAGAFTQNFATLKLDFANLDITGGFALEKKLHNFATIEAGITENISVALKVDYNYEYYNGYNGPTKVDGTEALDYKIYYPFKPIGATKVAPVPGKLETQAKIRYVPATIKKEKSFHGLELAATLRAIFGGEFNLRLGIEHE